VRLLRAGPHGGSLARAQQALARALETGGRGCRAMEQVLGTGGDCERIRTGAAGPRVENVGGCRGEGSGRCGPNVGRPRPSRRRRGGYGAASQKERRQSEGGDWAR
jgi:hypothetical protein